MALSFAQLGTLILEKLHKLTGQLIYPQDVEDVATATVNFVTNDGSSLPPYVRPNSTQGKIPRLSNTYQLSDSAMGHFSGLGGGVQLDGGWRLGNNALRKVELFQPPAHAANRYETLLTIPKGNFGKVTLSVKVSGLGASSGLIHKIFTFDANADTGADSVVVIAQDDVPTKIYLAEPDWSGASEVVIPIYERTAGNTAKIYVVEVEIMAGTTFMTALLTQSTLLSAGAITSRSAGAENSVIPANPNTQMSVTADGLGVKLSGDVTTPGNLKFYGTDDAGARGWLAQTSMLLRQMSIDLDANGLKLSGDVTSPGNLKFYGTNGAGARAWLDQTSMLLRQMSIDLDVSGLKLSGDVTSPGNLKFYGTNGAGVRGWLAQTSMLLRQMSIDLDANGLKLSGDVTSPGNLKFYGTNGAGVRGWLDQTSVLLRQMSIDLDASGLKLSGDVTSPGTLKMYGTNGAGVRGWYDQPTGTQDFDLISKTTTIVTVANTVTKTTLVNLTGPGSLGTTNIVEFRAIGNYLQNSGSNVYNNFEFEIVTNAGTSTHVITNRIFSSNSAPGFYEINAWAYRESTAITLVVIYKGNLGEATDWVFNRHMTFSISSASSITNIKLNITHGIAHANTTTTQRLAWVRLM